MLYATVQDLERLQISTKPSKKFENFFCEKLCTKFSNKVKN